MTNSSGGSLLPLFLALALSFTTAPLFADDEDPYAGDIVEMETIQVTATRARRSIYDVAEAVTVIDERQVRRLAPDVLAQTLRGRPGTFFQQTTPGQGIPIIRGLKGSQVLHLVDGIRLNNAFFRNAPNQYLGLVDSYATDRVEVVRGAASSLYGADAMGGVVQILTPEPEFFGRDWTKGARLFGSFNSVDKGLVFRAEAEAGNDKGGLRGGVTWQDHSDRTVGGGGSASPSGYRSRAGDIKWAGVLGPRSQLMLSAQVLDQPSTPRVDELVPGFGQDHPGSAQYAFRPNRRSFLHARYRFEGGNRLFDRMEVHLARQVITDDRLTQEFDDPVIVTEENESTLDGLTFQFDTPWGSRDGNSLIWGFEYYADEISSSRLRTDSESGESEVARGRFPDDSTMDSAAAYLTGGWRLGRLSLQAGLRYSWFDIYLPAAGEAPAAKLEPDDLTGDIHLNYRLSTALHLVANVGRGFRPPNIFDLGTLGPRPGNRFNVPNPGLEPESVWSYDLGLKSVSNRWEAELFFFYSDYRDKITSVFTGESTPRGRLVVRSENLNEMTLYGIESGLRWRGARALEAYAALNYTRGEEKGGGATVPADRIPPLNGRLGFVYAPGNGLRLEPYLDFAAEQDRLSPRDEEDPRIHPEGTPDWVTLNLLLSWQAGPRMELGLRLENLTDENYREHGSGIDAPGRNIGFWFNTIF